jgi:hypothetical protein
LNTFYNLLLEKLDPFFTFTRFTEFGISHRTWSSLISLTASECSNSSSDIIPPEQIWVRVWGAFLTEASGILDFAVVLDAVGYMF